MDKHQRPYVCTIPSCNLQSFPDSGGLKRHLREVHGTPSFICPVITCKRHIRGFARKRNLTEHQIRTHDMDATESADTLTPSFQGSNQLEMGLGSAENADSAMGGDNDGPSIYEVDMTRSSSSEKTLLMAKLNELEALRAKWMTKIDGDIAAVKRTLSLM